MEFNLKDFRYISVARLKCELEKCEDSKDAFIKIIDSLSSEKYYWRVVIFRKDFKGTLFEVASFLDEKIADGYIENIIKKNTNWDGTILAADRLLYELPPWINGDHNLNNKINFLKNLESMEDENA